MEDTQPATQFVCAHCNGYGKLACKGCLLYCGKECQTADWNVHKKLCKSPVGKKSWQPQWVVENRMPAFIGDGPTQQPFGGKKYLWGNVPALDVLRLESNEGQDCGLDLRLLFAASGDLRNVVKTVASLPENYSNTMSIVINDKDIDIVARNVIMLLIVIVVQNPARAVDCLLHVWYSAIIRSSDEHILVTDIFPLIEDVSRKLAGKPGRKLFGKTWTFGDRSLRLVLPKEDWDSLLSYLKAPIGLTPQRARGLRSSVTLASTRIDYRERDFLTQAPMHRVGVTYFREDGILLPIGHSRRDFDRPNPTFFQGADWPMNDAADPFEGWDAAEVLRSSAGSATNDVYGKLFYFLRDSFSTFQARLSSQRCDFFFFHLNATELPHHVEAGTFARIETSNIADTGWLGIAQTAAYLGPLLQSPKDNSSATLLTLFLNAVNETFEERDRDSCAAELKTLAQYLPSPRMPPSPSDPQVLRIMYHRAMVRDGDIVFNKYIKRREFARVEDWSGLKMKDAHTIVEKWPMRLKLRPGQAGAQEEFDVLAASSHTGTERYVEWTRKS